MMYYSSMQASNLKKENDKTHFLKNIWTILLKRTNSEMKENVILVEFQWMKSKRMNIT